MLPYHNLGYYYDPETELYYLRARYYDPDTGRFMSQDDIGFISHANSTGLNLYAYCNNNPVMCIDTSGHMPQWLKVAFDFGSHSPANTGGAIARATVGPIVSTVTSPVGGLIGSLVGGPIGGLIGADLASTQAV